MRMRVLLSFPMVTGRFGEDYYDLTVLFGLQSNKSVLRFESRQLLKYIFLFAAALDHQGSRC